MLCKIDEDSRNIYEVIVVFSRLTTVSLISQSKIFNKALSSNDIIAADCRICFQRQKNVISKNRRSDSVHLSAAQSLTVSNGSMGASGWLQLTLTVSKHVCVASALWLTQWKHTHHVCPSFGHNIVLFATMVVSAPVTQIRTESLSHRQLPQQQLLHFTTESRGAQISHYRVHRSRCSVLIMRVNNNLLVSSTK